MKDGGQNTDRARKSGKVISSLLEGEILTSNWICSIWIEHYEPISGDV